MEKNVAHLLTTFETWLLLVNFDNVEWIRQMWVEIFQMNCGSKILEAKKKGRRGNNQPVTKLGEPVGKNATSNLRQLPNTTFMVMIH
jgi:hypothetical protein